MKQLNHPTIQKWNSQNIPPKNNKNQTRTRTIINKHNQQQQQYTQYSMSDSWFVCMVVFVIYLYIYLMIPSTHFLMVISALEIFIRKHHVAYWWGLISDWLCIKQALTPLGICAWLWCSIALWCKWQPYLQLVWNWYFQKAMVRVCVCACVRAYVCVRWKYI